MRIVRIPKRNGSDRIVYVPNPEEKERLRNLLPMWHRLAKRKCSSHVHGFMLKKSPVTNAMVHRGYRYTLNFDLQNFFDSVTRRTLMNLFGPDLIDPVLVDGAARQGLPTSPLVANCAATVLDNAVLGWLRANQLEAVVYSRYADDLSFSFNLKAIAGMLTEAMPGLVEGCGFRLAAHKTKLYSASNGRRMVTGVAVDDQVHPTRRSKRRQRAAEHQNRNNQAEGLKGWHNHILASNR